MESQYLELLSDVLCFGEDTHDRTGTGTKSVFGAHLRHDLRTGYPLLTTKRMPWKTILHELLWFLRGDTNVAYLRENGVTIWDEWADENGNLGPVYGHSWRNWGGKPRNVFAKEPMLIGLPATYLGVANGSGSTSSIVGKTWEGMISRCYNKKDIGYRSYGFRGVRVCDRWLSFTAFQEDYEKLPGWNLSGFSQLYLDKDGRGDGFLYSPDTCQWVSAEENSALKNRRLFKVRRLADGSVFEFSSPSEFCRSQKISPENFSDLWTGNKNAKTRRGFELISAENLGSGVDQIRTVIESIKNNPTSRRHIVSAWNVGELHAMALPPCHLLFQFHVGKLGLSCQVYQRSADLFLGLPFNIASYAALTMMVAQVCDLPAHELIFCVGDAHIYNNHITQVQTQLRRYPRELPKLLLDTGVRDIDDFTIDSFMIGGYEPHPAIKGDVSV